MPRTFDGVYGLCLHRSLEDDRFYAFVTSVHGPVHQFEVTGGPAGIMLEEVATWEFESEAEGCAVDDEHGQLYVTEETRGLWKRFADPAAPGEGELIDDLEVNESPLVPEVEGVAIYDTGEGEGYVVVSSQGDSSFAVYERSEDNEWLGSFAVGGSKDVDGVSNTDGLAVTDVPVDDRFPGGLLVVHDERNRGSDTSNFKYVSWADGAEEMELDQD